MRGLVYADSNNSIKIEWNELSDWQVKQPLGKHSIKRKDGGSCSFNKEDYIKFSRGKKRGIFLIDKVLKVYVFLSKEVLEKYPPESKEHHGMPNSFYVYSNIKNIINLERIEMIPFGKVETPMFTKPATDIRDKFGIKS